MQKLLKRLNIAEIVAWEDVDLGIVDQDISFDHMIKLAELEGMGGFVGMGTNGEGLYVRGNMIESVTSQLGEVYSDVHDRFPHLDIVWTAIKHNRDDIITQVKSAKRHLGDLVKAYLIAPPVHTKDEEKVVDLFREVSGIVNRPLIFYNIEGVTGFPATPEFLNTLYKDPDINLQAVKDSGAEPLLAGLSDFYGGIRNIPIQVICGNDRNLEYTLAGLSGNLDSEYVSASISGASNFDKIAQLQLAIHKSCSHESTGYRDLDRTSRIQNELVRLFKIFDLRPKYGAEIPIIKALVRSGMHSRFPLKVMPGISEVRPGDDYNRIAATARQAADVVKKYK